MWIMVLQNLSHKMQAVYSSMDGNLTELNRRKWLKF